ncbi:hypothetical protein, partial [Serratia marcescens]|uniref:hypothetical protein n=1 Tax=Serratia marcescens TaxID=615 RepID=UPI001954E233
ARLTWAGHGIPLKRRQGDPAMGADTKKPQQQQSNPQRQQPGQQHQQGGKPGEPREHEPRRDR